MGRLTVKGVSKVFGDPHVPGAVVALKDVSFEVPDNRFCAILGHSGCGRNFSSTSPPAGNPRAER
jgi:NitT/TauT family transport system ATP-binding protein